MSSPLCSLHWLHLKAAASEALPLSFFHAVLAASSARFTPGSRLMHSLYLCAIVIANTQTFQTGGLIGRLQLSFAFGGISLSIAGLAVLAGEDQVPARRLKFRENDLQSTSFPRLNDTGLNPLLNGF
jgi:hypothetical protein